ncbi:MAG: carboxypeptidase-like regulatory domain-containing protein, partial [Rudanella sp.]|nr:carboxypeptidase-like regulatory domain-containing protein [Rudanella sp.]
MKDNLPYRRSCRLFLLCLLWGTLLSSTLLAQTTGRMVTGTVRDEKNTAIPGVNIDIKGTGTPDRP